MRATKLTFITALLVGAFFLSSCTPPNPNTSDLGLEADSENFSLESNLNANEEEVDLSNANLDTSNQQNMEGQNMPDNSPRTLEDFKQIEANQVVLTTTKGEVVIDLFTDRAPLTTTNFLNLVGDGFYDGIVIHRVEPNFVVQFGDPLTKTPGNEARWGTGNPGYSIADEFHPELRHDSAGIISMANSGPNTGGSQIFITLAATPWLDDKHAVFGKVSEGMEIVEQLEKGDTITAAEYR